MRGEAELGMRVAMGFAATRETLSRSLSGADSAHRRPLSELSEKEQSTRACGRLTLVLACGREDF